MQNWLQRMFCTNGIINSRVHITDHSVNCKLQEFYIKIQIFKTPHLPSSVTYIADNGATSLHIADCTKMCVYVKIRVL